MSSQPLNIGMFGGGGVGKTAITLQYVKGEFTEGYVPTIEDSFTKSVQINGTAVNVDIIDTAGQDDFKEMRYRYYQSCDGFILVYSVIDKSSLASLEELYTDIIQARGDSKPIKCIMAGNKADMKKEDSITLEEAEAVARKFNCKVLETSAKTAYNITPLYETLISDLLNLNNSNNSNNSGDKEGGCCSIL